MPPIQFTDLKLNAPIQKSLAKLGYTKPTPIQEKTIPLALQGDDILGIAQTGTGKTASFCLPIIHHISMGKNNLSAYSPKALILTPTRELAIQIHKNYDGYSSNTKQKCTSIFGGVNQKRQVNILKSGVDTLVATPGRLLDLMNQNLLRLGHIEFFVLDEADRMLDMGFMPDIKRVVSRLPKKRHNMFFSATMPNQIQKLATTILNTPKKVEIPPQATTPKATTVKKIEQSVMYVDKPKKLSLLTHLLKNEDFDKTLVFVEMKYLANRIAKKLEASGIPCAVIHGNKSQSARQRAIQDFANNKVNVMLATDIASRGIDIDGITHVINYQLSNLAESYVHRIGRTARAGAKGKAVSLVTADEKSFLVNVEKVTHQKIFVDSDQPFHSSTAEDAPIVKVGKANLIQKKETPVELNLRSNINKACEVAQSDPFLSLNGTIHVSEMLEMP